MVPAADQVVATLLAIAQAVADQAVVLPAAVAEPNDKAQAADLMVPVAVRAVKFDVLVAQARVQAQALAATVQAVATTDRLSSADQPS